MDSDNDFTFCPVGLPVGQDGVDAKNLATYIGGITIKEEDLNNGGSSRSSGTLWEDKFLPNNGPVKKEETVGLLSFNVVDMSYPKQSREFLRQVESRDAVTLAKNKQEERASARKPVARAKVPFEKGYSQMDWLKLARTHPDLAGLKGQSNKRLISMNEVKQHQTEGSMWTVLKGRVYNLSPYMKFHPGGVDMLLKAVGKDCTSLFNKYHAWVSAEFLLEKCLVGTLDDTQ